VIFLTDDNLDFEDKAKLLELQAQLEQIKHANKMEELEYERVSMNLLHQQILERGRISRAEERKTIQLKNKF
jgi:hypothetical protein